MRIRKTKAYIMAAAAVLIAVYHLWIPVFPAAGIPGRIERFMVGIGYIGADLFFFLSAYTLALSDIPSRPKFILRRFGKIYPTFLMFCAAALMMGSLSFPRFLSTVFFLDFLKNGGGSFLWFIPALLLMYAAFPYCRSALSKYSPVKRLAVALTLWAALTFSVEYGLRGIIDVSILLCRVPAMLLGAFLARYEGAWSIKRRLITGFSLFLPGLALLYFFGHLEKLTVPFGGMFYIVALPCVTGLLFLFDVVFQNCSSKAVAALGGATLELYCLQMLTGGEFVDLLFRLTRIKILTNLLVFAVVFACSLALASARRRFYEPGRS